MLKSKYIAILLVAVMSMVVLAACGGGVAPEPQTGAASSDDAASEADASEAKAEEEAKEETAEEMPAEEAMEMDGDWPAAVATDGALAGIDPSGQTVIWWHNHSGSREERLMEIVDRFNAENPYGITIDAQNQGGYGDIR